MSDDKNKIGKTPSGGDVSLVNKDDSWKSRKFIVANAASYLVLIYAFLGQTFKWITEPTFKFLVVATLVTIGGYCGFNILEKNLDKLSTIAGKIPGIGNLLKKKAQ